MKTTNKNKDSSIPTEPLKSCEKKGTTLRRTRKPLQGEKKTRTSPQKKDFCTGRTGFCGISLRFGPCDGKSLQLGVK